MRTSAALSEQYGDAWSAPVEPVVLDGPAGEVVIGDGPVTLMGCVNLSRDSTYRESVATGPDDAVRMGRIQAAQGAAIIDLGAESSNATAARVSPDDQIEALVPGRRAARRGRRRLRRDLRARAWSRACLDAGARILNMTGREHEDEMLTLAARARRRGGHVLRRDRQRARGLRRAAGRRPDAGAARALRRAPRAGARARRRPRWSSTPGWASTTATCSTRWRRSRHQTRVLSQTFRLRPLGVPVCNVLPHTYDIFGDEFRKAEGFYAVFAALGGTHLLRIHEVPHLRVVLDALRALEVR